VISEHVNEVSAAPLTVCGCGELSTSSEAVRHETLEHDWVQVGSRKIDRCSVARWARANDDLHGLNWET